MGEVLKTQKPVLRKKFPKGKDRSTGSGGTHLGGQEQRGVLGRELGDHGEGGRRDQSSGGPWASSMVLGFYSE